MYGVVLDKHFISVGGILRHPHGLAKKLFDVLLETSWEFGQSSMSYIHVFEPFCRKLFNDSDALLRQSCFELSVQLQTVYQTERRRTSGSLPLEYVYKKDVVCVNR